MGLAFRSTRRRLFRAWLPPRLSRSARSPGLHGFLWRPLRRRLSTVRGFRLIPNRMLHWRRIAEVNRRVRAAGAFAGSESRNRPNRFDARPRRRHFRNRALPLRADLVAIVASAVDAGLRQFRRAHRRVLRKVPLLVEPGVDLLPNLFPAFGVARLFTRRDFFVESYRV